MKSIWKDIQKNFKKGTNFTKLLYINLGLFLFYKLILLLSFLLEVKDIHISWKIIFTFHLVAIEFISKLDDFKLYVSSYKFFSPII